MLVSSLIRSFSTLETGFLRLSVIFKYVSLSLNKSLILLVVIHDDDGFSFISRDNCVINNMSNPGYNFNIFNLIHTRYGSEVMKLARNLEKKSINIVKQKQRLTFNHELKRAKILPPSLRFNPPINCYEGRKIATKAGWGFMRLRINHGHQRIKQLEQRPVGVL